MEGERQRGWVFGSVPPKCNMPQRNPTKCTLLPSVACIGGDADKLGADPEHDRRGGVPFFTETHAMSTWTKAGVCHLHIQPFPCHYPLHYGHRIAVSESSK